ncbi:hypothetical protein PINS_up009607, partial [Pythium insidiosum]
AHDGRRQRVDQDVVLEEEEDEASDNEHADDTDERATATDTAATTDKRASLRPAGTSRASSTKGDPSAIRANRSASMSIPDQRQSISRRDAGLVEPRATHMGGQANQRAGSLATARSHRSSHVVAGDEEEESRALGRVVDESVDEEYDEEAGWQGEGDPQRSNGVNTSHAIVQSSPQNSRQASMRSSINTKSYVTKRQSKSSVTAGHHDAAPAPGSDRRLSMTPKAHDGRRQRVDQDVVLEEEEDEASDNEHADDTDERATATDTAATTDKRASLRPAGTSRASSTKGDPSAIRANRSASMSIPDQRQSISRRDAGLVEPRATHMGGQANQRAGSLATARSHRSSHVVAGDEEEESRALGRVVDESVDEEYDEEAGWQGEGDPQRSNGVNTSHAIVQSSPQNSRQASMRSSINTKSYVTKRQSKSSVTAGHHDAAPAPGSDRRLSMTPKAHDGRRQRVDQDVVLEEEEDEASDNEHADDTDERATATDTAATTDKRASLRPAGTSRASSTKGDPSAIRANRSASMSIPDQRQSISRRDAGLVEPRATHMGGQANQRAGSLATARSHRSSHVVAGDEEEESRALGRVVDESVDEEYDEEAGWQGEGDPQRSNGVNTSHAIVQSSPQNSR